MPFAPLDVCLLQMLRLWGVNGNGKALGQPFLDALFSSSIQSVRKSLSYFLGRQGPDNFTPRFQDPDSD